MTELFEVSDTVNIRAGRITAEDSKDDQERIWLSSWRNHHIGETTIGSSKDGIGDFFELDSLTSKFDMLVAVYALDEDKRTIFQETTAVAGFIHE